MITQAERDEMARLRALNSVVWSYAALGRKYHISKQRVSVLLNPVTHQRQVQNLRRYHKKQRVLRNAKQS